MAFIVSNTCSVGILLIQISSIPVGVKVWHSSQYVQDCEPGPPEFLPLHYIKSHIARFDITIGDVPAWATITVGKVSGYLCHHSKAR